jgi:hypothetical protein
MKLESTLSRVVFPEPVPPEMTTFRRPRMHARRKSRACTLRVPNGIRGELPDGQDAAVQGYRRDDRVDAGAIGQPGVYHRGALVDPAANPADDLVDGSPQMGVAGELRVDGEDLARTLDEDVVRPVHHDLADLAVTQQRLQRPEAQDLVRDLLGNAVAVRCRQRRVLGVDHRLERLPDPQLQLALLEVGIVQLRAE